MEEESSSTQKLLINIDIIKYSFFARFDELRENFEFLFQRFDESFEKMEKSLDRVLAVI